MPSADDLIGAWDLVSFEIEKDGVRQPWGETLRGQLIYTREGRMSVGFNREPVGSEPQAVLDSILFYGGNFRVAKDGRRVIHDVETASAPDRVGKTQTRWVELDPKDRNRLRLSSDPEAFGQAFLVWKRV